MPNATITLTNEEAHKAIRKYVEDKYGVITTGSSFNLKFNAYEAFLGSAEVYYQLAEKKYSTEIKSRGVHKV